ncbi:hypothetical protein IFVP69_C1110048 [Vibrio parahaemolyticus]
MNHRTYQSAIWSSSFKIHTALNQLKSKEFSQYPCPVLILNYNFSQIENLLAT